MREREAIKKFEQSLGDTSDQREILRLLVEWAAQVLQADEALVYLPDDGGGLRAILRYSRLGYVSDEKGVSRGFLRRKKRQHFEDISGYPSPQEIDWSAVATVEKADGAVLGLILEPPLSYIHAPLQLSSVTPGRIEVRANFSRRQYDEEDVNTLLEIAHIAGIKLDPESDPT